MGGVRGGGRLRLGVISDSLHGYDAEGRLHNHNAGLRAQLDCWARLFERVVICAPLVEGEPPDPQGRYREGNVSLIPVPRAGGRTLKAKAALVSTLPAWWRGLKRLLAEVDAVHVRCPNNISIPGLLLLERAPHLRQALYTGNWAGYPGESPTYRLQRWFLRERFRGPVAVYGEWPGQPPHVVSTFSPVFGDAEWEAEAEGVAARLAALRGAAALPAPVRLVTVGHLDRNKNQRVAVEAVARLKARGVHAELDVVGKGAEREALEALAASLGVAGRVRLQGQRPHDEVREFYRRAHFLVLPSRSEGWSKVAVEAFLHGTVPLLADLPVHRVMAGDGARGRVFGADDAEALAGHVAALAADPRGYARMVEAGREYARGLTLEAWTEQLRGYLEAHWGVTL